MKIFFSIAISILLPICLFAQGIKDPNSPVLKAEIETFIKTYLSLSDMKDPDNSRVTLSKMNKFQKLFLPDAKVFDDINPDFDSVAAVKPGGNPYTLVYRTPLKLKDGWIENFDQGMKIFTVNVNTDYADLKNGNVYVTVERIIDAKSIRNYRFFNEDVIRLTIRVESEKKIAISSIEPIILKFKTVNDNDLDGVIDEKDKCREVKGYFRFKGCPDASYVKEDIIPDATDAEKESEVISTVTGLKTFEFMAAIGYQLNNHKLEMPDPIETIYNADNSMDKVRSKKGEVSDPGYAGGPSLQASLAFFPGKNNKRLGVSVGISWTKYSADYSAKNTVYHFRALDDENNSFRKIISLQNNNENFSFSIINLPLLLRYRVNAGSKWGIEFNAGPSYLMVSATTKSLNALFDIEGIYQANNAQVIAYDPNYDPSNPSPNDILLTEDAITATGGNPNVVYDNMYANASEYDFQIGNLYTRSRDLKSRSGIAVNAGIDVRHILTDRITFKGGVYGLMSKLKNDTKNGEYKMLYDNRSPNQSYNSYYNSKTTTTLTSFGINLGISIGF